METTAEIKKAPVFDDDAKLAYLPFHGIIINALADDDPAKKPTSAIETLYGNQDHVPWGDDDDYPGYVVEQAELNTLIPAVNQFKANAMAAADMHYGFIKEYDQFGKPVYERFEHEDIELFWERNNKRLFLEDGYRNLFWWNHAFAHFHLNKAKTYIGAVAYEDTAHCRYAPQNKITGNKDFVIVDANWPQSSAETQKKIRCIDPYFDWSGQLRNIAGTEFLYPIFFNSPKKTYYQSTPWHSVLSSKWLDLAKKIPIFKAKVMDNQMSVKYVVYVPSNYWSFRYKDWEKKNPGEREIARKETIKEFNDTLTGVNNAGKTLVLNYHADMHGKSFGKWDVQEMKNTLAEGAFIEDSQEASDHILFAMAFDGTLIGKTPGKGMGAGSGSDKRLADEIFYKNNKAVADKKSEVLSVITNFNRWKAPNGKRIHWFQEQTILTTLNNVNPEKRP